MLAGPLVFFTEFREFIFFDKSPSPIGVVLKKMFGSILFAVVYIRVAPNYDIDYLRGIISTHYSVVTIIIDCLLFSFSDEDFLQNTTFIYKLYYITCATTLERTKYYHAWILSDAVCNASGLGYNKKTKSWDLVTNVDAIRFELGLNLKESLDEWNKGTMRWLRYVVYERVGPNLRTVATYATSATWHGFYPGYYISFFSGALFTSSARIVRSIVLI